VTTRPASCFPFTPHTASTSILFHFLSRSKQLAVSEGYYYKFSRTGSNFFRNSPPCSNPFPDCYLAVAGLPEPQPDHALRMARFAQECLFKFNELVRRFEVQLGPDTGDLQIRMGLHSGPARLVFSSETRVASSSSVIQLIWPREWRGTLDARFPFQGEAACRSASASFCFVDESQSHTYLTIHNPLASFLIFQLWSAQQNSSFQGDRRAYHRIQKIKLGSTTVRRSPCEGQRHCENLVVVTQYKACVK
jgi:hypothetical protein